MKCFRFTMQVLAVFLSAAALIVGSKVASFADERVSGRERYEIDRQWKALSDGRAEFDVSDPWLVPSRLADAFTQSNCRWQEQLKDTPLRIVVVAKHRLALLVCHSPAGGSHEVFDLSDLTRPRLLRFPYFTQPDGFGVTSKPGSLTWDAESGILQAVWRSDQCGRGPGLRHVYRWRDNGYVDAGFVIVRVDITPDDCDRNRSWKTIWSAPQWDDILKPQP